MASVDDAFALGAGGGSSSSSSSAPAAAPPPSASASAAGGRRLAECPPCGAESLLPICRALAVAGWGPHAVYGADEAALRSSPSRRGSGDAEQEGPPGEPGRIFSTRRPRDAFAGAASGLKTVARSLAAGARALVECPVVGYQEAGALGGLLGLGEGAGTAALLPCAGAALGAAQCVRGVANTPEAFVESLRGFVWDLGERKWGSPGSSLKAEEERIKRQADARRRRRRERGCHASGEGGDERFVGARTVQRHVGRYYELLCVQPSASSDELRRAYYRESRRCHPDKVGPGNALAVVRFQELSEAYKVLRSPELRRAYDVGGSQAVDQVASTIDLGALYAALLSAVRWEPFLGALALRRILSADPRAAPGASGRDSAEELVDLWCAGDEESADERQVAREVRCATRLAERLRPLVQAEVDDDEGLDKDEAIKADKLEYGLRSGGGGGGVGGLAAASALAAWREEAAALASAPFGPPLLRAAASVYDSEAGAFLGALGGPASGGAGAFERSKAQAAGRLVSLQAAALAAGARAALALSSLEEEATVDGEDERRGCRGSSDGREGEEHCESEEQPPRASVLCLERPAVRERLPALATCLWRLTLLDLEGTLRRTCRRVLRDSSESLPVRVRRAQALQALSAAFVDAAEAAESALESGSFLDGEQPKGRGRRGLGEPGESALESGSFLDGEQPKGRGRRGLGEPGEDEEYLFEKVREVATLLAAGGGARAAQEEAGVGAPLSDEDFFW